jgi:hypothetical protein
MNMKKGLIRIFPLLKGGKVANMLADHCWNLIRDTPTGENKRQKKPRCVFNAIFLVRILCIETLFVI